MMTTRTTSNGLITRGVVVFGVGTPWIAAASGQIQFDIGDLYVTPVDVSGVATGDFNGDGDLDVAICERLETVSMFLNYGDGELLRVGQHYEPGTLLSFIHAADLDGDGLDDLMWFQSKQGAHSLQVFYTQSGGAGRLASIPLNAPVTCMAVGNVLGDPLPDVVLGQGGNVQVLENQNGRLSSAGVWTLPHDHCTDMALGDLNSDGDLDIAVLNHDGHFEQYEGWKMYFSEVHLLINNGAGGFDGQSVILPYGDTSDNWPVAVRVGDLDGDSDIDMVVAVSDPDRHLDYEIGIAKNENAGADFTYYIVDTSGVRSSGGGSLAIADFDTDGDLDIINTVGSGGGRLLENQGRLNFAPQTLALPGGSPDVPPVLADMNGDGQTDFVVGGGLGMQVDFNATPYDGPVLEHTLLKRGARATLTVQGATPGEQVHFLYSLSGAGNSAGIWQFGGLTLDLGGTIRLAGSALADANGVAELSLDVPGNAPLRNVVLQAAIRRGARGSDSVKTLFRMTRIADN